MFCEFDCGSLVALQLGMKIPLRKYGVALRFNHSHKLELNKKVRCGSCAALQKIQNLNCVPCAALLVKFYL